MSHHLQSSFDGYHPSIGGLRPKAKPTAKAKMAKKLKAPARLTAKQRKAGYINQVINSLPYEMHVPGYNYLGPGTDYVGRSTGKRGKAKQKPVNDLDAAAMMHDMAYQQYAQGPGRLAADKKMRCASKKIYKNSQKGYGERAAAFAAEKAFALKNYFEGGGYPELPAPAKKPRGRPAKQLPLLNQQNIPYSTPQENEFLQDSDDSGELQSEEEEYTA